MLKLLCEMIGDARWNLNSTSTRDQPGCGSNFNWTLKDTISSSARFVPNTPSELYFLSETTSLPDLKIWESLPPPPPPRGLTLPYHLPLTRDDDVCGYIDLLQIR